MLVAVNRSADSRASSLVLVIQWACASASSRSFAITPLIHSMFLKPVVSTGLSSRPSEAGPTTLAPPSSRSSSARTAPK